MVAPELSAHVESFLLADTAYFSAVEKRHALHAEFEKELTDTSARIRALAQAARALAGVLHLEQVLQLRAIVSSLDRGTLRADLGPRYGPWIPPRRAPGRPRADGSRDESGRAGR